MKKIYYLIFVSFLLVSCTQPTPVALTSIETTTTTPLLSSTPSPMPSQTLTPILTASPTMTPTAANSAICGSWSSQEGSVGAAISQKYGEIRNCLFFDNSWIITTLGLQGQSGIVAVYRCASMDSKCLNGQTDHPITGWHFYTPPCSGGMTVVSADPSTERILIYGGCALWFDVANGTFSKIK